MLMNESHIRNVIEAALLAAGKPLQSPELIELFDEGARPQTQDIQAALAALSDEYSSRGIEVKETAAGFRIQVKREFANEISRLWPERPAKYSRALLETLALIAYRQPITRAEIEAVRGVAVNPNIIKTVIERSWVRVVGTRDVPGRPELLGTTRDFLDYFGLKSLDDLPPLVDIKSLGEIKLQFELPDAGPVGLPGVDVAEGGADAATGALIGGAAAGASAALDGAAAGPDGADAAAAELAGGASVVLDGAAAGPAGADAATAELVGGVASAASGDAAAGPAGGRAATGESVGGAGDASAALDGAPTEAGGADAGPDVAGTAPGAVGLADGAPAVQDVAGAAPVVAVSQDGVSNDAPTTADTPAEILDGHAASKVLEAGADARPSSESNSQSDAEDSEDEGEPDSGVDAIARADADADDKRDAPIGDPVAEVHELKGAPANSARAEAEKFAANIDAELAAGDDDSGDEDELSAEGPSSSQLIAGPRDLDD
jgi:segregation and condensation protein B